MRLSYCCRELKNSANMEVDGTFEQKEAAENKKKLEESLKTIEDLRKELAEAKKQISQDK